VTLDIPIPPLRMVETIPIVQDGEEYVVLRDPQGFSESMIAVAPGAMPILAMFDGQKSAEEIGSALSDLTGAPVDSAQIVEIVQVLDKAHLLQNGAFLEHRLRREEEFRNSPTREAALAGSGYPESELELRKLLDDCLAAPPPQDFEPEPPREGKPLTGLLVPHIDYKRGGSSYGRAYCHLRDLLPPASDGPLLVVIIGVAHQGALEPIVACPKDFVTPLGSLRYDRPAMTALLERLGESIIREQWVHRAEHSIELQVLFLQHLLKDREVTILPLLAGMLDPPGEGNHTHGLEILAALKEVTSQHAGPVLHIASVDFAHVGPAFGDTSPVDSKQLNSIETSDMESLNSIRTLDASGWLHDLHADDNSRRVCGINATWFALNLLKGSTAAIQDYAQAVSADHEMVVSFASAIFQVS